MTITAQRMADIAAQLNGTYINVDGAFGNQCWDSAARVAQLLGLPVVNTGGAGRWPGWAGNMWDAYPQTAEIGAAYVRVSPEHAAQPGDTAIWGDSYAYYPATHVATVIKDAGGLLLCLSQNSSAPRPDLPGYSSYTSGPTIIQHLPKNGLLGYLRPRNTITPQGTITQEEDDFMALFNNVAEFRQAVADVTQPMHDTTRQFVKDRITENGLAVLNGSQAQEDVTRDYLRNQTQAQQDVTRQYLADRIRETSPAEVAALIPDDQAQAFIDALVKRLAK